MTDDTVPTDQELVLGFRPDAVVVSRVNPRSGVTEYQVNCAPVSSKYVKIGWVRTEVLAWRAACVRMGLRVKRA
jgi:hypothetical protein